MADQMEDKEKNIPEEDKEIIQEPVEVSNTEQTEEPVEVSQEMPKEQKSEEAVQADEIAVEEEAKEEKPKKKSKKANKDEKEEKKWYVVQTYATQEEKVRDSIERNVKDNKMGHKIFQVLVPTEDTIELRDGKRVEKVKKMFPGYVFIEMLLDDESWYIIRGTPGVAKFIGTKVEPIAVSDREMQRVLKQLGVKQERLEVSFERGEAVRIISGPFRGYTGSIDEVNAQKGKLKTLISIFGRDTPVEVNFEQVQRMV